MDFGFFFFFFFFILRFLQDTVVEEWTILVIERERETETNRQTERDGVSVTKCYAMKPSLVFSLRKKE